MGLHRSHPSRGRTIYWPSAEGQIAEFINSIPKVVFSQTLATANWHNTRVAQQNVPQEVSRLKQETGRDIFVYASADLASTLITHDLVNEYRIAVSPGAARRGHAVLQKGGHDRRPLTLVESRPLSSGLVILHYRPAAKAR